MSRAFISILRGSAAKIISNLRVTRALGNGTRTYINSNTFSGGTSQRSQTNRFPVRSNSKVYRVKVRLQLFYQATVNNAVPVITNPFVDTLFPDPLNFQFAIKSGYENAITNLTPRTLFQFGGADYFSYPGATAWSSANPGKWFIDSDWVTLDGSQLLDLWSTVSVPTGQALTNPGKLPLNRQLSNAMPRGVVGNIASASGARSGDDHIALGYAQNGGVGSSPTLAMTAVSTSPTGSTVGFAPSMLIIETDAGTKTALIAGTSHAEGISEGSQYDVYNGVPYADAFGDANGARGMWEAGVFDQGWNYLNMGLPSDWEGRLANTHAVAVDASQGWRNIVSDLAFDHIVWEHCFNDFAKTSSIGTYPAAGVTVKKGQTTRNATTGRMLLCTTPGTTTVGVPASAVTAAPGDTYTDGNVVWRDLGAYSTAFQLATGPFGSAYAASEMLSGMFPNVPVTRMAIPLPNGLQTNFAITSLTSSGTAVTATTADTSALVTGEFITIAGASPTSYNGTYAITVVDATHFTYNVTTAPASTPATGSPTWTDNFQSLAGQTAVGPGGSGIGSGRDLYRTLIANNKNTLVKYVNLVNPSPIIENDFNNLDGKIKAEMGAPFKWQFGSHLTGYAAAQCKVVITSAILNQTT
jgi:hypothetical protein